LPIKDAGYCYRQSNMVGLSLYLLVTFVSPAKRLNWSRCRLGTWLGWAQGTMYFQNPQGEKQRFWDYPAHWKA